MSIDGAKWSRIDKAECATLPHISEEEYCYYLLNRTSAGYAASPANDIIDNFKKDVAKYGDRPNVMYYKRQAIDKLANEVFHFVTTGLERALDSGLDIALVPMPTSKVESDPAYDDRIVSLCKTVAEKEPRIRVANVFHASKSHLQVHYGGSRKLEDIANNIRLDDFSEGVPDFALLIDDVLTTGAHYAVCRDALRKKYGSGFYILGVFLSMQSRRFVDYDS